MSTTTLLADDPAGQIRNKLTLLNLRSESIHRLLNKHAGQLPALNTVIQYLRHYDKDPRKIGWSPDHYDTLRHNVRILETQLATSHLRGPLYSKIYRAALTDVEFCEDVITEILNILDAHPDLATPQRADEPPLLRLEAFPKSASSV